MRFFLHTCNFFRTFATKFGKMYNTILYYPNQKHINNIIIHDYDN